MTLRKLLGWLLLTLCVVVTLAVLFLAASVRTWHTEFCVETFSESARQLTNPDRGFYRQSGYVIQSGEQSFDKELSQLANSGFMGTLEMVQINLRRFQSCEITDAGLENIDRLFEALSQRKKRYIVRFLYDWSGKAIWYEPRELDIILRHMEQLAPVLQKYSGCIYTLQGLFIGNWGEMNGTPFTDAQSLKALANQLARSAPEEIPLSVRMPMYWRRITDMTDLSTLTDDPLARRIGLYNDGMLGNETDCGTYGTGKPRGENPYTYWTRSEELAFQQELCKYVPNGGEAIRDNVYNDFENAVSSLNTMHVSYLNIDYDKKVLDKWAQSTVTEPGCYQGMDGLSYVERHLGYRYLIDSAQMSYNLLTNRVTVGANLKNVGFAPAYSGKTLTLTLKGRRQTLKLELSQQLCSLTGGNQSNEILFAGSDIPLTSLHETSYRVYLDIRDDVTGQRIQLANEQASGQIGLYGVYLGDFSFERVEWYETVRAFLDEIKIEMCL